ncbi:pyroglutamyl-peptidase I [Alkaliphilus sp. B6464]|uniref:pyroglutamyl-peptidase I n=1 Tax=Alkaliphilus sp. B6464 TaxID=2731219 RepID=UPI001BAA31DA|nr:pyroglutamyl-peptidase I [Alkaliphilus sp. B6464]QUH18872.1 pyroglutamyl-peptidase I [Alkaliphilus sp. B6464]
MKILVTGFDPFGGESINPATEAIKLLPKEINGAEIVTTQIPTVFGKSIDVLFDAIKRENPDITICIGQAGGRFQITVERVAINIDDARIKDNEGNAPIDTAIFEDGAPAYFSNLPIKAMVQAMKSSNIPAAVSNTAGTFVCNHLMYGALYYVNKYKQDMKAGFIHIPYIVEQVLEKANTPSMNVQDIVKGLTVAIQAVINNNQDINVQGGAIC